MWVRCCAAPPRSGLMPGRAGAGLRRAVVAQDAALLDGRGRAAAHAAQRRPARRAGGLRARGVTTLATALYRSRPLDEAGNDFPRGLCVVIGSEGRA